MSDAFWMAEALSLAETAGARAEVPIGAIIVCNGSALSSAFNIKETSHQPCAHAEILAIERACERLGKWRLSDCSLYVTLEPCVMCAGAIVQARLARVVYGATDPKAGGCESLYKILADPRLNHRPEVVGGVRGVECGALLSEFFAKRRG